MKPIEIINKIKKDKQKDLLLNNIFDIIYIFINFIYNNNLNDDEKINTFEYLFKYYPKKNLSFFSWIIKNNIDDEYFDILTHPKLIYLLKKNNKKKLLDKINKYLRNNNKVCIYENNYNSSKKIDQFNIFNKTYYISSFQCLDSYFINKILNKRGLKIFNIYINSITIKKLDIINKSLNLLIYKKKYNKKNIILNLFIDNDLVNSKIKDLFKLYDFVLLDKFIKVNFQEQQDKSIKYLINTIINNNELAEKYKWENTFNIIKFFSNFINKNFDNKLKEIINQIFNSSESDFYLFSHDSNIIFNRMSILLIKDLFIKRLKIRELIKKNPDSFNIFPIIIDKLINKDNEYYNFINKNKIEFKKTFINVFDNLCNKYSSQPGVLKIIINTLFKFFSENEYSNFINNNWVIRNEIIKKYYNEGKYDEIYKYLKIQNFNYDDLITYKYFILLLLKITKLNKNKITEYYFKIFNIYKDKSALCPYFPVEKIIFEDETFLKTIFPSLIKEISGVDLSISKYI